MSAGNGRLLLTLAATIAVLLVLGKLAGSDPTRRNWEIFTEMQYSPAYEPMSPNPNFANGSTEQQLPAGVVPRGRPRFRFGPGPDEADRAGRVLETPYRHDDPAAVEKGGRLFQVYCTPCHGGSGEGRGPVVARGMLPPPSLLAAHAEQMKDGQMFHVLTRGQGNMASYAAQLDPSERWLVITYVRSLQGGGK